jgi:hypothetical protein
MWIVAECGHDQIRAQLLIPDCVKDAVRPVGKRVYQDLE